MFIACGLLLFGGSLLSILTTVNKARIDLPDFPNCLDPEVEKFEVERDLEEEELDKPIITDDYRIDKTQEDFTKVNFTDTPLPTKRSIQLQQEILNDFWEDTNPNNDFLYDFETGPTISMVTRREWGAIGCKRRFPLKVPVSNIRFSYTGPLKAPYHYQNELKPGETFPTTFPEAMGILSEMQKEHQEAGFDDIKYNFLIGEDAQLWEGRGFYVDVEKPPEEAHLKDNCLEVAYMGDFKDRDPSWPMIHTAVDVIRYGIETYSISPVFKVIPFRK